MCEHVYVSVFVCLCVCVFVCRSSSFSGLLVNHQIGSVRSSDRLTKQILFYQTNILIYSTSPGILAIT